MRNGPRLHDIAILTVGAVACLYVSARAVDGAHMSRHAAPIEYYGKSIDVFRLYGQDRITEAGRNLITNGAIYHAPGVTVDQNAPDGKLHIYVVDSGNSRVLGLRLDCPTGETCAIDGSRPADVVLGQPDFNSGSCNGDVNLGFTKAPTDSCLCLLGYPLSNNTAESWMRLNIDVDAEGNVYVPDTFNNRVLRYNQPLSNDRTAGKGDGVADFVWGQPNMTSNGRNHGDNYDPVPAPSDDSLWLNYGNPHFDHVSSRGVSVDNDSNLWVADTFNSRVLRFPPGEVHADLVLGQPNFTSWGPRADGSLDRLNTPTLARVHPATGELYVLDEYPAPFLARLLVFTPPFENGMVATRTIEPQQSGTFINWGALDGNGTYQFQCTGFAFNNFREGAYANGEIWVNEHSANRTLLLADDGSIVAVIGAQNQQLRGGDSVYFDGCGNIYDGNHLWSPGGSIGQDNAGNIYLADEFFSTVFRYALPYSTWQSGGATCLPEANGLVFVKGPNIRSDDRLGESVGLAVHGGQLLIRDEHMRLKVYNNYASKPFGSSADVVVTGGMQSRNWLSAAVDEQSRLWLAGEHGQIRVFQLPLSEGNTAPVADFVPLYWGDTRSEVMRPEGGAYVQVGAIAFDRTNHYMYLADASGARIFRVSQYSSLGDSLFVDLVIGQESRTGTLCNRGMGHPTQTTLCAVSSMKVDNYGNLFVVDNVYECSGNHRIVVFNGGDLAAQTTMFPSPAAWKLFNAPSFDVVGDCAYWTVERPGSPVSLAFDSSNHLVVGNDGYYGLPWLRARRQLWYYEDPLVSQEPDAAIDIYMGTPGDLAFDEQDNLLIQDHTWCRVVMINLEQDPEWLVPVNATAAPDLPAFPEHPMARLSAGRPNPFNPRTWIDFELSEDMTVRLSVYDVRGRLIRVLLDDHRHRGTHEVSWDGRDLNGREVASGVYMCRLESQGQAKTVRLVLLR